MTKEEALYDWKFGEDYDEDSYDSLEDAIEGEVEETGWGAFEIDGEEYIVADEDEALELAKESIQNLIDDVGVFGFSDYTTNWILDYALDTDWFEEAHRESNEFYFDDILNEASSDDDLYVNRAHEEAVLEYGLTQPLEEFENEPDEDDFETEEEYDEAYADWENNVESERSNMENEVENLREDFVERMMEGWSDSFEWYKMNFGDEELQEIAKSNNLVDEDAVIDMIIEADGIAHVISSYDGNEHDLEGGYTAYRTN